MRTTPVWRLLPDIPQVLAVGGVARLWFCLVVAPSRFRSIWLHLTAHLEATMSGLFLELDSTTGTTMTLDAFKRPH